MEREKKEKREKEKDGKERFSVYVGVDPIETRVAVFKGADLDRYFIDRRDIDVSAGSIYLGRVVKVIPGIRAAFIDVGIKKSAFLPATQVVSEELLEAAGEGAREAEEVEEKGEKKDQKGGKGRRGGRGNRARGRRRGVGLIERSLREGEEIMVQVIGVPGREKGAKVTTYLSIPGNYVVFMPTIRGHGISRKIVGSRERARLKEVGARARAKVEGGFIMRSASEGVEEEKILAELDWLERRWKGALARCKGKRPPQLILPELSLPERVLRELAGSRFGEVIADDHETFRALGEYAGQYGLEAAGRVRFWNRGEDMFGTLGIEEKVERALARKIPLASGGTIVIDQAEALTAIDVNTGSFTGERDHFQTVLTTNLEAVREIAYQLRLRSIGGLVILDLIDMEKEEHREQVYRELLQAVKKDKAKMSVRRISDMGLIEMTRERQGPGIMGLLQEKCWYCDGTGSILSRDAVCGKLLRAIANALAASPSDLAVKAHPSIALRMENEYRAHLAALGKRHAVTIGFEPQVDVHMEYFKLSPRGGGPSA